LKLLPGIYLKINIPVPNGKELSPSIIKIYAEYFNELLRKVKQKEN
jgi:hypothetical protein